MGVEHKSMEKPLSESFLATVWCGHKLIMETLEASDLVYVLQPWLLCVISMSASEALYRIIKGQTVHEAFRVHAESSEGPHFNVVDC